MPEDAKSRSCSSSSFALYGEKKSAALSDPSGSTDSRTTDSPSLDGGALPAAGVVGERAVAVANMILRGPSDTSPEPDCQIPPPKPPGTATQRALTSPAVETPKTHPCHVPISQS